MENTTEEYFGKILAAMESVRDSFRQFGEAYCLKPGDAPNTVLVGIKKKMIAIDDIRIVQNKAIEDCKSMFIPNILTHDLDTVFEVKASDSEEEKEIKRSCLSLAKKAVDCLGSLGSRKYAWLFNKQLDTDWETFNNLYISVQETLVMINWLIEDNSTAKEAAEATRLKDESLLSAGASDSET